MTFLFLGCIPISYKIILEIMKTKENNFKHLTLGILLPKIIYIYYAS